LVLNSLKNNSYYREKTLLNKTLLFSIMVKHYIRLYNVFENCYKN
jgi:hypothetical protein